MTYLTIGLLLAEEPNRGPDYGKASPVGLLVVVLLLLGVFMLGRSMSRHLKRVPESFDDPADPAVPDSTAPDPGTGAPETGDGTAEGPDAPQYAATEAEIPPREPTG